MFDHIAVVGAGAWGSALANVIARAGRAVLLAARDQDSADRLEATRQSPRLPGVTLDETIGIAASAEAVGRYDAILLAVPSQHLRAAARHARSCARRRHAGDRLRQGHRARHAQIHDRGDRRERAATRCRRSSRVQASRSTSHTACRPPSRSRHATATLPRRWPAASARRRSGSITPTIRAASRSAAPPRTCWRSRPAS